MNIIRYEPWNLLNDINTMIENTLQRSERADASSVETSHWIPAVDIKENDKNFVLMAELPGMKQEDIEISMENNVLSIKGQREEIVKEDQSQYHRRERRTGRFYRVFTLPETADAEHCDATMDNGILEITIPKKATAKPRRISVKTKGK